MKLNSLLFFLVTSFFVSLGQLSGQSSESDDAIKRSIALQLETDPTILSDQISVSVSDGIVTLDGSVRDLLERRRAAKVVTSRKGVRSLINTLSIVSGDRSDEAIQRDALEALSSDHATANQAIKVAVLDGIVQLQGEVDYHGLRQVADIVVSQIYGARGIENHLTVNPSKVVEQSDEAIASHLDKRFSSDVWLNDLLISIVVKDGEVILSGSVDSLDQLTRAKAQAWVPGVQSVDAAELKVEPGIRDDTKRDPSESITDEEIQSAVSDGLRLHSWIDGRAIEVEVTDGTVSLSGQVPALSSKIAAEALANDTVGVKQVNNQLIIETPVSIPDEELREAVISALKRNTYTYQLEIEITSDQGKIGLYGTVGNNFLQEQVEVVAAGVYGVKSINNELQIKGSPPSEAKETEASEE